MTKGGGGYLNLSSSQKKVGALIFAKVLRFINARCCFLSQKRLFCCMARFLQNPASKLAGFPSFRELFTRAFLRFHDYAVLRFFWLKAVLLLLQTHVLLLLCRSSKVLGFASQTIGKLVITTKSGDQGSIPC